MVHSEVYLNKYVANIAPFSPLQKTALLACFRFLIFRPFFHGGSAYPICPYVWTPMTFVAFFFEKDAFLYNCRQAVPTSAESFYRHSTDMYYSWLCRWPLTSQRHSRRAHTHRSLVDTALAWSAQQGLYNGRASVCPSVRLSVPSIDCSSVRRVCC